MAQISVNIETRPEGRIAWVTLENAAKANCLTSALVAEMETVFRDLANDDALRLAVLTGAGSVPSLPARTCRNCGISMKPPPGPISPA